MRPSFIRHCYRSAQCHQAHLYRSSAFQIVFDLKRMYYAHSKQLARSSGKFPRPAVVRHQGKEFWFCSSLKCLSQRSLITMRIPGVQFVGRGDDDRCDPAVIPLLPTSEPSSTDCLKFLAVTRHLYGLLNGGNGSQRDGA